MQYNIIYNAKEQSLVGRADADDEGGEEALRGGDAFIIIINNII